ncbi:MAG: hypothetical protein M0008_01455 [Actinomycetota bacterium]|nr:hypothetical protein [Actinomycetota bacterium]
MASSFVNLARRVIELLWILQLALSGIRVERDDLSRCDSPGELSVGAAALPRVRRLSPGQAAQTFLAPPRRRADSFIGAATTRLAIRARSRLEARPVAPRSTTSPSPRQTPLGAPDDDSWFMGRSAIQAGASVVTDGFPDSSTRTRGRWRVVRRKG